MNWRSTIQQALAASGRDLDADVVEELSAHAASFYQEQQADGVDADAAEQQTKALITSWCEEAVRLRRPSQPPPNQPPPVSNSRPFVGLMRDVRYAFQVLRRRRAFTGLSILTMAMGIGVLTTLFSVAYGVLWKPLPWPEPERLIRLSESRQGATRPHPLQISNGTYLTWQDQPTTIENLAGFWTDVSTIAAAHNAERVVVGHVTASVFPLLRAKPLLGSAFTTAEEASSMKAVLSYGFWQDRFAGDPDVIGKSIAVNGAVFTISAVMKRDFVFPDPSVRVWIPYHVRPVTTDNGRSTSTQIFNAMARLRPGATIQQTAAEGTARGRFAPDGGLATMAFWGVNPGARIDVTVIPALDALTAEVRPGLIAIMVAAALLLLAAMSNAANLQLTRASTRQREVAIRSAIGASVGRIAQQFVVESIVLGAAAGIAGVFLAAALHRVLPAVLPADFPRSADVSFNMPVALFACLLTLVTSILVGLLPALYVLRVNLVESLTEDANASIGGKRRRLPQARTFIMTGQVAIACVLLTGAALLGRSFVAMIQVDRGYDPGSLLTATLPMPAATYSPERQIEILDGIVERIRALPSVTHAAYTDRLPLLRSETLSGFGMPSKRPPIGVPIQVHAVRSVVSPDFLQTFGMRVIAGRAFNKSDTASSAKVIIVNRSFAKQYLSDAAIGDKVANFAADDRIDYEVVGVIDDVTRHDLDEPIAPEVYSLNHQTAFRASSGTGLAVRTTGNPRALIQDIRRIVKTQDSNLALDSVMTMEDRLASTLARPRLYAVLFAVFAVSSLVVAAVGLFAVLSYSVSHRTREFALRAALGARPLDVIGLVIRQGAVMTLVGIVAGVWSSFAMTKYLSGLLYGVTAHDWISFAGVAAVIAFIATAACIAPALRAVRINPSRALAGPRN